MMRLDFNGLVIAIFLLISWVSNSQNGSLVYESPSLQIKKISEQTYIHISYLDTEKYGKVACNGMFVISDKEAVMLETPINDEVSEELINWIEKEQEAKITAVIVHHFHVDCLGGLKMFHKRKIPSFANQMTINLASGDDFEPPLNAIQSGHKIRVGNEFVTSHYFGQAHTEDNIVSYIPAEGILFGGCMVKALGASKGNIEDADVKKWPQSIRRIKEEYPSLKWVVPGHGKAGGVELLDYTITLFTD